MRSRARSSRLPRKLLRGAKMLDGISGEEIYQRSSTTRFQRGMYMHKKNYDDLTTQQMEEMLQATVQGGNLTYEFGQGNEVPNYSNLPTFPNDAAAIAQGYVLGMPYLDSQGNVVYVGFLNPVTDTSGNIFKDSSGNIIKA